jgi:multiple sugar transport system substrate-binding protein
MRSRFSLKVSLVTLAIVFTIFMVGYSVAFGAGSKTIKMWTGYPERVPVYKEAAADYMKEHPDVNVEIVAFDLRQSEQKFAIALPAGSAPDLFEGAYFIANQFINEKKLDPAPAKVGNWLKKNFDKTYLNLFTSNNKKIYAIPTVQGFQVLYYNKDHFNSAGLTVPPQNLDQLMTYARKLAKYDNKGNLIRSGISLRISGGGSGVAEKFEVFLFANGASVLKQTAPGKQKANFANEAGYKALNFYLQALHKYKVDSFNIKHDSEAFELGLASMFNRETWVIGDIKKRAPGLNYGIAQVPAGSKLATNLVSDGLIIPASGKNKDLAWDFAMYLNKDKYLVKMMKEVGWICSRKGVDYSEVYKNEPHFEQALTRPSKMKLFSSPPVAAVTESYTKFAERLVAVFSDASMVDNKTKIMKFLNDAANEVNNILKSYDEYGK